MIESRTTRQFWDAFAELPPEAQQNAKNAYRLFRSNPAHRSLHFKKLEGEDNIYSVRIGLGYRALRHEGKPDRLVLDRKPRRLRSYDLMRGWVTRINAEIAY